MHTWRRYFISCVIQTTDLRLKEVRLYKIHLPKRLRQKQAKSNQKLCLRTGLYPKIWASSKYFTLLHYGIKSLQQSWPGPWCCNHTVDGRNPAPPGVYKTMQIMGYLPYQLVSRISSINSMARENGLFTNTRISHRQTDSEMDVFFDVRFWLLEDGCEMKSLWAIRSERRVWFPTHLGHFSNYIYICTYIYIIPYRPMWWMMVTRGPCWRVYQNHLHDGSCKQVYVHIYIYIYTQTYVCIKYIWYMNR